MGKRNLKGRVLAYSAHLGMRLIPSKEHQGCVLALHCHKTKCGISQAAVAAVKFFLSLLYAYRYSQFPVMHLCGKMPIPSFECIS